MMRWFRWGTPRRTTEVNAKTKEAPHRSEGQLVCYCVVFTLLKCARTARRTSDTSSSVNSSLFVKLVPNMFVLRSSSKSVNPLMSISSMVFVSILFAPWFCFDRELGGIEPPFNH